MGSRLQISLLLVRALDGSWASVSWLEGSLFCSLLRPPPLLPLL